MIHMACFVKMNNELAIKRSPSKPQAFSKKMFSFAVVRKWQLVKYARSRVQCVLFDNSFGIRWLTWSFPWSRKATHVQNKIIPWCNAEERENGTRKAWSLGVVIILAIFHIVGLRTAACKNASLTGCDINCNYAGRRQFQTERQHRFIPSLFMPFQPKLKKFMHSSSFYIFYQFSIYSFIIFYYIIHDNVSFCCQDSHSPLCSICTSGFALRGF